MSYEVEDSTSCSLLWTLTPVLNDFLDLLPPILHPFLFCFFRLLSLLLLCSKSLGIDDDPLPFPQSSSLEKSAGVASNLPSPTCCCCPGNPSLDNSLPSGPSSSTRSMLGRTSSADWPSLVGSLRCTDMNGIFRVTLMNSSYYISW